MKKLKRVVALLLAFAFTCSSFAIGGEGVVERTMAVSDLEAAEEELNDLQSQYDSGAFGFFEYRSKDSSISASLRAGAKTALDILKGTDSMSGTKPAGFDGYTVKGDAKGATALPNIGYALKGIAECNDCRALENRDEGTNLSVLKVNDICMAMAMKDANYSSNIIGHACVYNVAENIGWGYGYNYKSTNNLKADGVFAGWYTEEKAVYKSGGNGVVGHYTNVVHTPITATGFAVTQKSTRYGDCQAQVYDWFSETGEAESLADYERYYNSYVAELNTKIDEAKAKVAAAKGGSTTAVTTTEKITTTEKATTTEEVTTTTEEVTTTENATTTENVTTTEAVTTAAKATTETVATTEKPISNYEEDIDDDDDIIEDDIDDEEDDEEDDEDYRFTASGFEYEIDIDANSDENVVVLCGVDEEEDAPTNLVVPDTVKNNGEVYKVCSIANYAFKNCDDIKTVIIGKYVKDIGTQAFAGCKYLKKVTLGAKVAFIDAEAFYGCKKLKTVDVKSKKFKSGSVKSKAFKGVYSKIKFLCPSGKKSKYKKIFKKAGAPKKAIYK